MTTEAATRLERCLQHAKAHPQSAVAQFNLGLAYMERGRRVHAEQAYREAVRLDPDRVEAWINLGGLRMLEWDFKGCIEANQQVLRRDEKSVLAHYNIGQACLYLGNGEGVLRANRRVIELDDRHAAAHYFLGVGLLAVGQVEAARQAVGRAKALGHSPTPEFLRALEAEDSKAKAEDKNPLKTIGAPAPIMSNRR